LTLFTHSPAPHRESYQTNIRKAIQHLENQAAIHLPILLRSYRGVGGSPEPGPGVTHGLEPPVHLLGEEQVPDDLLKQAPLAIFRGIPGDEGVGVVLQPVADKRYVTPGSSSSVSRCQ